MILALVLFHFLFDYQIKVYFMPLLRGAGTDNAYFTMNVFRHLLNIPCESAPDFSDFKKVTITFRDLLAETTTTFPHDVIKNGKSGDLVNCLDIVLGLQHLLFLCQSWNFV